jgi:hypothetical protein
VLSEGWQAHTFARLTRHTAPASTSPSFGRHRHNSNRGTSPSGERNLLYAYGGEALGSGVYRVLQTPPSPYQEVIPGVIEGRVQIPLGTVNLQISPVVRHIGFPLCRSAGWWGEFQNNKCHFTYTGRDKKGHPGQDGPFTILVNPNDPEIR